MQYVLYMESTWCAKQVIMLGTRADVAMKFKLL